MSGVTVVWAYLSGIWTNVSPEVSPWVCIPSDTPVYDAADRAVFTLCRDHGNNNLALTYEYSTTGWVNLTPSVLNSSDSPVIWGPGGYTHYTYDPISSDVVVVVGFVPYRGVPPPTWTWTFSGGKWSNVSSVAGALPAMSTGTLAFDSALGGDLLRNATKAWLYRNGSWASAPSWQGPFPVGSAGFDPALGVLLDVDGSGGTWSLGASGWTRLSYVVRPFPSNAEGPVGTSASWWSVYGKFAS
ncbi:MAG TPA: hypothetical protein VFF67_05435 [Thermoplasmata archaeon]|nr:hypothetical protein [Thermoplasmata archaeon]